MLGCLQCLVINGFLLNMCLSFGLDWYWYLYLYKCAPVCMRKHSKFIPPIQFRCKDNYSNLYVNGVLYCLCLGFCAGKMPIFKLK